MQRDHPISFGDNVRIRSTTVTRELGLAGLLGNVYGEMTPSVTGVEVIGETGEDYAAHVHFEEHDEDYWFAPELLEFADHAAGTEISLESVEKKWTRSGTGEWIESEAEGTKRTKNRRWKFW